MKRSVHWYDRRAPERPQRLEGEVQVDAVVVGGGVAGLTCAQRLRAAGLSVAVVERDFCGAGASGRSSGFITPDSEIELASLIANCGRDEARRIWEFVCSGVELIRSNIRDHGFDCDYDVQDSLYVASAGPRSGSVRSVHEARLALGYPSRFYGADSLREALGTSAYLAGVRYDGTFSIDPYAYCQELRNRLVSGGTRVYEDSAVAKLGADGIDTERGAVRARHVVVCTDRFIPDMGALEHEIYHVQTFLGISSPLSADALRAVFPDGFAMTWDTELIYNYFRVVGGDRMLLGGGDLLHTYARAEAASVTRFARDACAGFHSRFPGIDLRLESVWSGMLGVSKDLLPVMGPDPVHDTIWYAGAATGLPWAAALGAYAAERIVDQRMDFDEAFSPARKFVIGPRMQAWLSTPLTYAIANGIAKLR